MKTVNFIFQLLMEFLVGLLPKVHLLITKILHDNFVSHFFIESFTNLGLSSVKITRRRNMPFF